MYRFFDEQEMERRRAGAGFIPPFRLAQSGVCVLKMERSQLAHTFADITLGKSAFNVIAWDSVQ